MTANVLVEVSRQGATLVIKAPDGNYEKQFKDELESWSYVEVSGWIAPPGHYGDGHGKNDPATSNLGKSQVVDLDKLKLDGFGPSAPSE